MRTVIEQKIDIKFFTFTLKAHSVDKILNDF